MATYVLIHGASSSSWDWHRVVPLLEGRGHEVIAPDLPAGPDVTFSDGAAAVAEAVDGRPDPIVVPHSLGGFTGPLVGDLVPARLLVMLAPMIPAPGESAGDWWDAVGFDEARRARADEEGRELGDDIDVEVEFFHDVPADVVAAALAQPVREPSSRLFDDPWPLAAWPDVPTRVLIGAHDRFFPPALQRRVAHDRLGLTPDEIPTGHLPALAAPDLVATHLETYRLTLGD